MTLFLAHIFSCVVVIILCSLSCPCSATQAHARARTHTCTHMCARTHTCTHVHTHVHTRAHTRTHSIFPLPASLTRKSYLTFLRRSPARLCFPCSPKHSCSGDVLGLFAPFLAAPFSSPSESLLSDSQCWGFFEFLSPLPAAARSLGSSSVLWLHGSCAVTPECASLAHTP